MLTGILISLCLLGSPDSTKQVQKDKKVIEHKKQLKQAEKPFDDTLKLLQELKAIKEKKRGSANNQAKLQK